MVRIAVFHHRMLWNLQLHGQNIIGPMCPIRPIGNWQIVEEQYPRVFATKPPPNRTQLSCQEFNSKALILSPFPSASWKHLPLYNWCDWEMEIARLQFDRTADFAVFLYLSLHIL